MWRSHTRIDGYLYICGYSYLLILLFQVLLRAIEMIKEARGLVQMYEAPKSQRYGNLQSVENLCVRRYASYTIHNMTSLPFIFHVYQGLGNAEDHVGHA